MLVRHSIIAATVGVAILSACTVGPSGTSLGSVAMRPAISAPQAGAQPDEDCRGIHGVQVAPCPVHLTGRTKAGIVVTVSGPGVVNSYLVKLNSCFNGKLCYFLEREGNSQTQWRITPGQACGGADIEFYGVNAQGSKVGYAFLKSTNTYCP